MPRIVPASSLFAGQRTANDPPPNTAPTNVTLPTISGVAQVGASLSATTGAWAGTPPITYGFQWQRGVTNIGGATNATYTVVSGDLGSTLRVVVTATNVAGNGSATSANTAAVVNPPASPVNTAAPTVSGAAVQGSTLTASPGTWSGDPPITFAYQWQRGITNIAGATASTYLIQAADVGQTLRVAVSATNAAGAASATSANTATVTAAGQFVTGLTGSGTREAGIVGYSGTITPSNLSPAPLVYVDVLDGSALVASEAADTVSGGLFSGAVTAAAGATLRVEAVGGAAKTSTAGQIGTTVTMELP